MKRVSVALAAFLLLVFFSPAVAVAGSGLTVLDSSAEMDFPMTISFNISTASDSEITDIRLHYQVERQGFAQVTSEVILEFTPADSVDEQWVWDMRRTGGLPPGSSVTYWWTLEDAGGDRVATEPAEVLVEDNRYDWHSLTEGKVTLYWYQGDATFAGEVMAAAQGALSRLAADTGAALEEPVKIFVYASAQDLRGSMIFPQEWTGGVAFTRYGVITIGISPNNLGWGSRAIAHELTHMVVHQVTFSPYGGLPTWLDEGLAMSAEGELEPEFQTVLDKVVSEGSLITVRSLASPFSAYAGDASLSYAESYSIVKYLIETYGREKMFDLLRTFRQGSSYDGALEGVYGFDMDGLDARWREHIVTGIIVKPAEVGTPAATGKTYSVLFWASVGVAAVVILAAGVLLGVRAWRRRR